MRDSWRHRGFPADGKVVFSTLRPVKAETPEIEESRKRKLAAEAAIAEFNLSVARSEHLPVQAVITCWQGKTANARAKLLALPPKIASAAIAAKTPYEIETTAMALVCEALEELAGTGMPATLNHRLTHLQNGHAQV